MWLSTTLMKKKEKSSFVSDVNKSQYRDTHSEDTIGNVRDSDYLSFVWTVSSKQHTINTIGM